MNVIVNYDSQNEEAIHKVVAVSIGSRTTIVTAAGQEMPHFLPNSELLSITIWPNDE
jgi:hypothetical protein